MARFNRMTVYNTMIDDGLVPLFYNSDLDTSKRITQALYDGGCRVLEVHNEDD